MNGRNPCDVCNRDCDLGNECVFAGYTVQYQCFNYDCFLNHDGNCLVSVFDRCGAWKGEQE